MFWIISPSAFAQVDGIHTTLERPLAVRGGVLMLPLTAERHGDGWPDSINLRMDDASVIRGDVIWIDTAPPALHRRWTDDPRAVTIRAIRETDDTSRVQRGGGLGPWLVARLPANGEGNLRLNRQTLVPIWKDRPDRIVGSMLEAAGAVESDASHPPLRRMDASPALPDPSAPLEYWRWVLLADRLGAQPPSPTMPGPPDADVNSMVAEHEADRWRVGLHRLAEATPESRSVAAACRDLLTRTCTDRLAGVEFAAWETDPEATSFLLSRLLDFDEPVRTVIDDALAWADSRTHVLMWPARTGPDAIELAVVNAGVTDIAASFQWISAPESIPIAAELPVGVLTHVQVRRPVAARPTLGADADERGSASQQRADAARDDLRARAEVTHVLEVQVGDVVKRFTVAPPIAPVRPPGFLLPPLRPPFTLHEVRSGRQRVMPPAESTFVQVRRRDRRWEVFIDCRRPRAAANSQGANLADFTRWQDVRGVEAVTLFMEPSPPTGGAGAAGGRGGAILTVPEQGSWHFFSGGDDGTLEVHRRSYDDRWLLRIVLADNWISPVPGVPTQVGLMRTHHNSPARETAPSAGPPWRPDPGRLSLDLTRWEDLPVADE